MNMIETNQKQISIQLYNKLVYGPEPAIHQLKTCRVEGSIHQLKTCRVEGGMVKLNTKDSVLYVYLSFVMVCSGGWRVGGGRW